MHFSTINALLFAGLAAATIKKIGQSAPVFGRSLAERQTCTSSDSCEICFGPGNVPCTIDTCYNPSGGEQCCADGTYCVADTNACCDAGPGPSLGTSIETATGFDSTPSATDSFPTAFFSETATQTESAPSASASSWDCMSGDTDEECCERGGSEWRWCSGGWPNRYCYRPSEGEVCCSDGSTCNTGPNCCAAFGAFATTPVPTSAAAASTSSFFGFTADESSSQSSRTPFSFSTPSPSTTRVVGSPSASATTGIVVQSTEAGSVNAVKGAAAIAVGLLGLAFL